MASSEKIAELAARLRNLANGISTDRNDDPHEESRNTLRKAAAELEQCVLKNHSHDDSYLLVLVDAHSHPFNNDILYRSTDLSHPALDCDQPFNMKERLHEAVRKYLIGVSSTAALGTSRIVVRIYANTSKLENDLLCPLQQFALQFSSMDPDFDFCSVRDETIVELKVVDAFQAARKNAECKHIFLAAWRRPVYIAMLQTPSENVTLVQEYGMGAGARFVTVPYGLLSIPEVFRKPAEQDLVLSLTSRSNEKHIMAAIVSDEVPCKDGRCELPHATTSPVDMGNTNSSKPPKYIHRQFGYLPEARDAIPGHVPINVDGERLDYRIRRPSSSDWQALIERFRNHLKPCRWFHLAKSCHFRDGCSFNHSPISDQVLKTLRYSVKRTPCSKSGECRIIDCIYGHVCQETRCLNGGLKPCSMRRFHGVNLAFASRAKGKHAPKFPTGGAVQVPEVYAEQDSAEPFWF